MEILNLLIEMALTKSLKPAMDGLLNIVEQHNLLLLREISYLLRVRRLRIE